MGFLKNVKAMKDAMKAGYDGSGPTRGSPRVADPGTTGGLRRADGQGRRRTIAGRRSSGNGTGHRGRQRRQTTAASAGRRVRVRIGDAGGDAVRRADRLDDPGRTHRVADRAEQGPVQGSPQEPIRRQKAPPPPMAPMNSAPVDRAQQIDIERAGSRRRTPSVPCRAPAPGRVLQTRDTVEDPDRGGHRLPRVERPRRPARSRVRRVPGAGPHQPGFAAWRSRASRRVGHRPCIFRWAAGDHEPAGRDVVRRRGAMGRPSASASRRSPTRSWRSPTSHRAGSDPSAASESPGRWRSAASAAEATANRATRSPGSPGCTPSTRPVRGRGSSTG